MNFNKFLQSLFGNKSSRDMKLIQPIVEKVKAEYPNIKALSNDQLRAKTKEIQQYVQNAGKAQREKIAELKATIEDTPIDQREDIFNQIDKLEKEALDNYEVALNEVLPTAFSIVKDTARRFAENEETVVTATEFDRELAANPANDFITRAFSTGYFISLPLRNCAFFIFTVLPVWAAATKRSVCRQRKAGICSMSHTCPAASA